MLKYRNLESKQALHKLVTFDNIFSLYKVNLNNQ